MLAISVFLIAFLAFMAVPNFVHSDIFKQHALRARLSGYLLIALGISNFIYVTYNAVVNGASAIGRRGWRVRYLFQDDPGPASLVLLVNIAFVIAAGYVASECFREQKIWLK